jgi:hypothetical protein
MKFNDLSSQPEKQFERKEFKKEKSIQDFFDIKSSFLGYNLYPNVAVYYVQEHKKLPLAFLSTLLNNGTTSPSWIIRYYTEADEWNIQFSPNFKAKFNQPDYSVILESFNKKFNTNAIQYKTQIIFSGIKQKEVAESVIQILVNVFKDKELEFESSIVDPKFKIEESSEQFKIPFIILDDEQLKYNKFLGKIKNKKLSNTDQIIVDQIEKDAVNKNKISEDNVKIIKGLIDVYLTESEKIETVMSSLYSKSKNIGQGRI